MVEDAWLLGTAESDNVLLLMRAVAVAVVITLEIRVVICSGW